MRRASKGWPWLALGLTVLGVSMVAVLGVRRTAQTDTVSTDADDLKPQGRTTFEAAEIIYEGGLKPGWTDGGWGPHELAPGEPARISFEGFGGINLQHAPVGDSFGALVFQLKAPPAFGDFLRVSLRMVEAPAEGERHVDVTEQNSVALPDGWREVSIPFRALNRSGGPFTAIVLQARSMVAGDWVLLDKIVLSKPDADSLAGGAPRKSAALALDCKAEAASINPLIYGIASGVGTSGESAHRVGGNTMTRLNWDLGNVWNTGSDWYFENVRGDSGLRSWIDDARAADLQLAVTVPLLGWVAKDSTSVGFPLARFGKQRAHDPQRPEAGDGFSPSGDAIAPGPPSSTSEPTPPERIKRWVSELRERDKASGKRGVHMYLLDNEPDLWHKTHRDVHPEPLGYDELLDKTLRYASAVREADPEAVIAGPSSWGWTGYHFSAKDQEAGFMLQPDRRAHGGTPLLAWYLQQLAAHEKRTGVRLLDVLNVHYYPQAPNVYGAGAAIDDATRALRIRSTRSLWDPGYEDESWIKDRVRLIPRLREWVAQNYPGRGVSLGEWSFGAEEDISGALATAEALGRFGQQKLTAAFYWRGPKADSATYHAFRAYRNYDGKGARFLDYSVPTTGTAQVSIFASRSADSSRFVLVLLNLDPVNAAQVTLELGSCGQLSRQRGFSFTATTKGVVEDPPPPPGANGAVLAPYSIKVLEYSRQP